MKYLLVLLSVVMLSSVAMAQEYKEVPFIGHTLDTVYQQYAYFLGKVDTSHAFSTRGWDRISLRLTTQDSIVITPAYSTSNDRAGWSTPVVLQDSLEWTGTDAGWGWAVPADGMAAGYVRFIFTLPTATDNQGTQTDSMSLSIVREKLR
jgi:hypothetical protein